MNLRIERVMVFAQPQHFIKDFFCCCFQFRAVIGLSSCKLFSSALFLILPQTCQHTEVFQCRGVADLLFAAGDVF